jgi:hypothetical protein
MKLLILALVFVGTANAAPTQEPAGIKVPIVRQTGEANCGPTTAAMLLAAYFQVDVSSLRDEIGEWSWPKRPNGFTSVRTMLDTLNQFGRGIAFSEMEHHPWIPIEAWSILNMKAAVTTGKPVVVLADAPILWDTPKADGMHWIVVTGFIGGIVVANDPSDGSVIAIPMDRFWGAWRLGKKYRNFGQSFEAVIPNRSVDKG